MSSSAIRRDLIVDRLIGHARSRPSAPALYARVKGGGGDEFVPLTFAEYEQRARAFAAACIALGMPVGGAVGIVADSRVEWVLAAIGAQMAGGMTVGIYQTSTAEQTAYILRHSEAWVAVLENLQQWQKLQPLLATLSQLRRVVLMDGYAALSADDQALTAASGGKLLLPWDQFLSSGTASLPTVAERIENLQPDQIASLIYTSGTTGTPKGVILTHHNLAWTAACALQIHHADEKDVVVSYLPMSHIAEQLFSLYLTITSGARVYFSGGIERIKETLLAARPTLFLAVPRVWEKFQAGVVTKLQQASPLQRRVIAWARDVGTRTGRYRLDSGKPFGLLALEEKLAQKLFFTKLKTALGLERVRVAITGSAAIRKDVLDFFLSLQLPIYEVYGLSESSGPLTCNAAKPGHTRLGTVGRPLPGTTLKLAEDGEVLFQGPNVCAGYFKNPEATAQAIKDGWLYTGDVGEIDSDGFLRITDRKKDLFKTSGGKYVAPQLLEGQLRSIPLIAQAVIIGESRKYLTALLTLEPERALAFAKESGLSEDLDALAQEPKVLALIQEHVDRLNKTLARFETIKRITLLGRDFTVANDEMTPSQKLKRKVIYTRYAAQIDAMYPEADSAQEG